MAGKINGISKGKPYEEFDFEPIWSGHCYMKIYYFFKLTVRTQNIFLFQSLKENMIFALETSPENCCY